MAELDISFRYDSGEEVFSSFSLSVERGEHILVLSPPGSGKSTLARILTGSIPRYRKGILSGYFAFDGIDVLGLDIPERLRIIGRVSQDTDEMLLFSSVHEELSFPLENMGLGREDREERIDKALLLFGLERYRDVSTSELSGGEKRRLMLSVLFAIDPEIYVLDESFDELSPSWRKRLSSLLKGLDRTVIVLGSHELAEYAGTFDRIITIRDGKAAGYTPAPPASVSFVPHINEHSLEAEDLVIVRDHRSSGELPSFILNVPSFSISGGECVTLLGENGTGKSSLSRVLSGLLKERSGRVAIDGRDVPEKVRRHRVAYLMQNPYEELFLPTVGDELRSTKASKEEISKVLRSFSFDPDEYVQEMSYGRAKLLQAALFYLLDRPFAIFDELDSALSSADFMAVVSAYLEKGVGLMVITHDLNVARMIPGRRFSIREGLLDEC